MLKKIYYSLILFGCGIKTPEFIETTTHTGFRLDLVDKTQYLLKLIFTFMPIAYLLNVFHAWFPDNEVFFRVLVWTIFANLIVGGKVHWDSGTFNLKTLLWKNIEIGIII